MTTLNVNVGVLGHVDSGKTSLSKALSRVGSTAAFDKNPQSQERGITLDLGFSAFDANVADDASFQRLGIGTLQFTLVDCPGHASLIRTVLGGAQIIDLMILVIDVTKGIQTQTAECIVVGEILSRRLVVVLNKVDAVQGNTAEEKQAQLQKTIKKLRATFAQTRWPNVPFIQTAANPAAGQSGAPPVGIDQLTTHLVNIVRHDATTQRLAPVATGPAPASMTKDLLMLVDHCFPIKGQGTVLTGTVLQGAVNVGDEVFLPDHQQTKRVKGIQMFRKAVQSARKGDRIGMCVTQFNAELMERGIVCGVGGKTVLTIRACIAEVHKVRFHKLPVEPNLKYHVTVGHSTVMGSMRFFSKTNDDVPADSATAPTFDFSATYDSVDDLPDQSVWAYSPPGAGAEPESFLSIKSPVTTYYAVLLLEQPVTSYVGSPVIVSRLDSDVNAHTCRIAAHGIILTPDVMHSMFPSAFPQEAEPWRMLNVVKPKRKIILIDRVIDERHCIAKSITQGSQNPDPSRFIGAKITLRKLRSGGAAGADELVEPPCTGIIEAPFGQSGKVKLRFDADVFEKPVAKPRSRRGGAKNRGGGPASGATGAADGAAAEDGDDAGEDEEPAAQEVAGDKAGSGAARRTRIHIDLAYIKRPFATKHKFA